LKFNEKNVMKQQQQQNKKIVGFSCFKNVQNDANE
jgi:hypothetical protein